MMMQLTYNYDDEVSVSNNSHQLTDNATCLTVQQLQQHRSPVLLQSTGDLEILST